MQAKETLKISLQNLKFLPSYAAYLLKHKLHEFTQFQFRIFRQQNLPLLQKFKDLSENEIIEIGKQSISEYLGHLAENRAAEQIKLILKRWTDNELPKIDKYAVAAEDINLVIYTRKQAFLHFIPEYCRDIDQVIELVKEIDLFSLEAEMSLTNTYLKMLNEKIESHSHFIEKITNTSPGIIYVYDVINNKEVYANKTTTEFLGYTPEEITRMGNEFVATLIHPDDVKKLKEYESAFKDTKDGEIRSFKYRIRNRQGEYHWLRTYETVFKRDAGGKISEKIGIAIDVHKQKIIADALERREQELLEAQEIAQLGSYTWDFNSDASTNTSPQTMKILELETFGYGFFIEKVHPEDRLRVEKTIEESLKTGRYDCEYRYMGKERIKTIWAKGIIRYEKGKPVGMSGTVMDITEKSDILNQLRENENLYKQAEGLTHIGSYKWNVRKKELTWSDELLCIYGIDPAYGKITPELAQSLTYPEDISHARNEIMSALNEKREFEFYYRILPQNDRNNIKILHARGSVIPDQNGEIEWIIGTSQDVTEKQKLIEKLERNESIYKQAEELANMGNWFWDIKENRLEWTDQLYRIYGLEPQSETITISRFLSLVHPDDRERVKKGVDDIFTEKILDYVFKIVTTHGETKILRSVAQVHRDHAGTPIFVIGTERDITEKQTLINQLRRSEKLYKQAQALAHVGNWSWDINSNLIEWSEELFHIYGLEPRTQGLSFEQYIELVHPDDREMVTNHVTKALEDLKPWKFNHRLIRSNGDVRILAASGEVITNDLGQPAMLVGTAQDITERQLLIERLQQSESLYKQAQSLARVGNWTLDVKTLEFQWSDEMYHIYELETREKFSFDEWISYMVSEEREEARNYFYECIRERKFYDRIHHIVLDNGKLKTLHRKGEFIYDKNGNPEKMIGTTQDITEEYRVQQELKENQMFIRKITDATPSIIASYNVNTGEYVFVSEGVEKLLGYSPEEVMEKGTSFFIPIIHPEDTIALMEKNARVLEEANANPQKNDFVAEFTYRMLHKDGKYRWFHTYGTVFDRNHENKVEHVLNISLDITDQVNASQTIKEQEYFIQQIADASPTILYLFDVESQSFEYINREIFFVLGYSPEEIINFGKAVTQLIYHPEDFHLLSGRKESGRSFRQEETMLQYECRMVNKGGEDQWMLVREIVFKTQPDGSIRQIIGAALDISKRKQMEKTILQNSLLLQQSNASLEEFAYVASHDLKEPLRKISTFGDRLITTQLEKLAPEGKIYLQKIVEASQRMQTMISDLLSISLISGNTAFEKFSLQKILAETLQTLEFKIENQNAVVESSHLPEARIIPSQFRQLFQNLLSNSLKFVRPGVKPLIRIQHSIVQPHELESYHLGHTGQFIKIEFSDNGIGFENEFAGKIFAIFQRLHGRSEYEGSGIGLSICKKIIEHHGGIIYATGDPDQGATFTIVFPKL